VKEHTRLVAARETLRARFDEQEQAVGDYFGLERKAQRLFDELSRLEIKMQAALGPARPRHRRRHGWQAHPCTAQPHTHRRQARTLWSLASPPQTRLGGSAEPD
jgi:hypothetical protein